MASIKKRGKKICATKFCTRPVRTRKNKKQAGSYCSTCEKKRWREKNPMKAVFQTLRQNTRRRAKQQGKPKPFTITFEDFKEFCYETNYMAGKGKSKLSYGIDCIVEELGYVKGNLQKLTNSANASKEQQRRKNKVLIYDWETKYATVK